MKRNIKSIISVMLCILLTMAALSGCTQKAPTPTSAATEPATTAPGRQMRKGLQTILLASTRAYTPDNDSFRNPHEADLLMLLILDESNGSIASLQLNPDTIVSFSAPGTSTASEIRLGETFSYGSGGSDSCLNLTKSISRLLDWIKIDHYMYFSLEAIGIVNKLIGGVELEVTEELAAALPGQEVGSTVKLADESITDFFDFRDSADTANEAHMQRQQLYIASSFKPFTEHLQQENFLTKLTLQLGDQMETDLTLSQMATMMETLGSFELDSTIHTLEGKPEQGGFRVDAGSVTETVNALFFD